ncbi:PREDICTED: uncharacterized protein LOC106806671 isoform X2 [Priapulus caudatus]|uniref:Uncharacterized protein LOC106806671 isoform X2 n=1 Tax=Priapulus caudatus TaxID=37621 RepID=A0ABM1DW49_PRICU|nr:PREDICTED: uncharacterized protein LOC106806671 isoform X2 [Priapulus caudatus]
MAFDLGYEQEKKILVVMTGVSLLGLLLMLISVSTNYWLSIDLPDRYHNKSQTYYVERHSGLWRHCKTLLHDETGVNVTRVVCSNRDFSTDDDDPSAVIDVANEIKDFARTEAALAIIGIVIMALAIVFAVYSFQESRYMYKRLAGCVYLLAAACIFVCCFCLYNCIYNCIYQPYLCCYSRLHLRLLLLSL